MSRWPPLPSTINPSLAYGVLQVREGWGGRLRHNVLASVDLESREVRLLEYLSRDSYDFGVSEFSFKVYSTNVSATVCEGDTFELEVDEADVSLIQESWSKVKARLLKAHVSKVPRSSVSRAKPKI